HRPAPGTALGPPARVRAVVDDGLGDRVVLQGGGRAGPSWSESWGLAGTGSSISARPPTA
ncbi:hypothetical protein, partial [Stenotrophomonas maltophilia]|uniref:hypothetical protein n=1 Tax=Stenotrophomonas maltophilia TaxID=40324 RepID=UPI002EDB4FAE